MSERRRLMMSGKSAKDFSTEYLTFRALEDTTFALSTNDVYYSVDNGTTWTLLTAGTSTPTILAGHTIKWKGELVPAVDVGVGAFSSTGNFDAEGNAYSLLYGDNFEDVTDISDKANALNRLFLSCNKLVHAKNLALPALHIGGSAYSNMFNGCTSLVNAPELPAIWFGGKNVYNYMFNGCTSLVDAPSRLPAFYVTESSYHHLFEGCTSLVGAPQIDAEEVARYALARMFYGCTSLTQAPILNITRLGYRSIENIFYNCSNLQYVDARFAMCYDGTVNNAVGNWLKNTAATGVFVKNYYAEFTDEEFTQLPEGWTIVTRNPYIIDNMPQGYTQVEYIASTSGGEQYIDLNFQMWNQAPIDYKFYIQANVLSGIDNALVLSSNDESKSCCGFVLRRGGGNNNNKVQQNRYQETTFGYVGSIVFCPNSKYALSTTTHDRTTLLFAGLDSSMNLFRFSETRLYRCKIGKNNGGWVRDLVPCIRNSDNKVGLYDLVNNVFYTNSGSGDDFVYNPLPNNNN